MRSRPCPRANREAGQLEGVYNRISDESDLWGTPQARLSFPVLVPATNGRGMRRFSHSVTLQHQPPTHLTRPAGCTVSGMLQMAP